MGFYTDNMPCSTDIISNFKNFFSNWEMCISTNNIWIVHKSNLLEINQLDEHRSIISIIVHYLRSNDTVIAMRIYYADAIIAYNINIIVLIFLTKVFHELEYSI